MADIDLIPPSYRRERRLRHWAKRSLVSYGLVLVCVGVLKVMLSHSVGSRSSEIEQLKLHKSQLLDKSTLIRELEARRTQLLDRLAALDRLRGGISTGAIFRGIDESLNEDIGFVRWEFLRAGEFVEAPNAVNTGYFIVVPETKPENEGDWRKQTHMSVKARASDHAALAQFANRLAAQPAVQDIKILNTRATTDGAVAAVDFDMVIRVRDLR